MSKEENYGREVQTKDVREVSMTESFEVDGGIETFLLSKEVEKNEKIIELINLASQITNDLLLGYGIAPVDIPLEAIHVYKNDLSTDDIPPAYLHRPTQSIFIKRGESALVFMNSILHELIHLKSANVQEKKGGIGLQYKSASGKQFFLNDLNEAVTEELTKRAVLQLNEYPIIKEDIARSKKMIQLYQADLSQPGAPRIDQDVVAVYQDHRGTIVSKFAYPRQRQVLNNLINKIYVSQRDIFSNGREILDVFAKAMFTGDSSYLQKVLETSFGKGVLDQLGEMTGKIDQLEHFVSSLK